MLKLLMPTPYFVASFPTSYELPPLQSSHGRSCLCFMLSLQVRPWQACRAACGRSGWSSRAVQCISTGSFPLQRGTIVDDSECLALGDDRPAQAQVSAVIVQPPVWYIACNTPLNQSFPNSPILSPSQTLSCTKGYPVLL